MCLCVCFTQLVLPLAACCCCCSAAAAVWKKTRRLQREMLTYPSGQRPVWHLHFSPAAGLMEVVYQQAVLYVFKGSSQRVAAFELCCLGTTLREDAASLVALLSHKKWGVDRNILPATRLGPPTGS